MFTIFVYGILGSGAWSNLVFGPNPVRTGFEFWRLGTWSFATEPDFFPVLGIAFFWSFGQTVENLMGRNKFAIWIGVVTVVPAVILTLLGALNTTIDVTTFAYGLNFPFLAAIWIYAATFPNVRFFQVVPLWAVAAVFTLLDILRANGDGLRGNVVFTIVFVAIALTAGRSLGFATAWPIPHIPLGAGFGSGGGKQKRSKPTPPKRSKRGAAGPRVVEGPWQRNPDTPSPKVTPSTGPSPADQAEMDGLLDKISGEGMDSLTSAEKQRLNELSKRLRNR